MSADGLVRALDQACLRASDLVADLDLVAARDPAGDLVGARDPAGVEDLAEALDYAGVTANALEVALTDALAEGYDVLDRDLADARDHTLDLAADIRGDLDAAWDHALDLAAGIRGDLDAASGHALNLAAGLRGDLDAASDLRNTRGVSAIITSTDDAIVSAQDAARRLEREITNGRDRARALIGPAALSEETGKPGRQPVQVSAPAGRLVMAASRLLPAAERGPVPRGVPRRTVGNRRCRRGPPPADPLCCPPALAGSAAAVRGAGPPPSAGIAVKRAGAVMRWSAGALTAIPVAVAGVSWHALAALFMSLLIVVAAVCWAIADAARTWRLASLIRACRGVASPANAPRARRARQPGPPAPAGRTRNSQRTG